MSNLVARPAQPSRAARFSSNESGTVAILFSLTAIVVLAMVGGAIDYGRAVHARYQMQEAVDSAVLAAARVWQTEADIVLAQDKGTIHYNNNKPKMFSSEVASFTPDFVNNTISMSATGAVPTPFLSPIGIHTYTVGADATARLDVGENAGHSVEISLMLDVTGSMCEDAPTCSKLKALKNAVAGDPNVPGDKGLIDIVIWDDQSEFTSKIALIPFSEVVNVGTTALANSVRGTLKTGNCLNSSSPCTSFGTTESSTRWIWGKPATWFRFTRASGSNTNTFKVSDRCVTERTGPSAYTDDAPNTEARKVGPAYLSNSNSAGNCGSMVVNTGDAEVNSIQPLTSDKALLKRRISKMAHGGGTAGQIGTAWAWYMLSPNWAYLWPSANQPKAYNTDKLVKYAILMTDGEYNTMYCNGAQAANSNSGDINCNATNGQAYTQARTLCTNMKTKGITVYTVGFQLDTQNAIDTLQQCASSPDKFFNAEDGVTLKMAFQAIALQIAKLSLSH
jgi:Flp pilus assembly protein TadG